MSSKQMGLRILAVIVLTTILAGCTNTTATVAPTAPPAQTSAPTFDLQATLDMGKTQAAQTVIADLTQTVLSATPIPPTDTPTMTATTAPTNTPLPPTAIPTATFIPWTSTPIYTPTLTSRIVAMSFCEPRSW